MSLLTTTYLPLKKGYDTIYSQFWSGIDLYNLVQDLQTLETSISTGGTGDIKSDGSINFTGQETFEAGLKTDNITDNGGNFEISTTSTDIEIDSGNELTLTAATLIVFQGVDAVFTAITGDILLPSGKINGAGWFTDNITDNGSDMIIDQTFSSGILTIKSLDNNIRLLSGLGVVITTASNGDLALTVNGSGVITMNGADTYTGTMVGAGGKSVVNGLIMD